MIFGVLRLVRFMHCILTSAKFRQPLFVRIIDYMEGHRLRDLTAIHMIVVWRYARSVVGHTGVVGGQPIQEMTTGTSLQENMSAGRRAERIKGWVL